MIKLNQMSYLRVTWDSLIQLPKLPEFSELLKNLKLKPFENWGGYGGDK